MSEPLAKAGVSVSLLRRLPVQLGMTGLLSWWLYVGVVWLSRDFAYGTPGIDRPLLSVMALFGAVFVLYLLQVWLVLRGSDGAMIRSQRRQTVSPSSNGLAIWELATISTGQLSNYWIALGNAVGTKQKQLSAA